jgi:CRP-like cAMP-binding protein
MTLWLTDILSPLALIHHVALFLIVVAIAMPTIALVRWLALIAGVVGCVNTIGLGYNATEGFWWALLVVVAVLRLLQSSNWRWGGRLSDEQEMFHQRTVPGLNAGQVRRLLAAGQFREVVPGTVLTKQGESIVELVFVVRGQVDIVVDGRKVADVGPGSLVGETGISTGEAAMATAVCATAVRYLGFEAGRLYRLLDSHSELQAAVELAVERSLRDKLNRSNMAAAHGERPPR